MRVERLHVSGLRCLQDVAVHPGSGLNLFVGPNGAGKTSLLEAVYLLSHGRSFRGGAREAMLRRGADRLQIYSEIRDGGDSLRRLGLERGTDGWTVRVDGMSGRALSGLLQHCAVVCFEPGSHALIGGGAEERRRFLDWGVFHVEHGFLGVWQRYRRALKQRNALLRADSAPTPSQLYAWEAEMGAAAQTVDGLRQGYLEAWVPHLREACAALLPELGEPDLSWRRGWDAGMSLAEALATRRDRDRARGHTTLGLHRADWRIAFAAAPLREHLSRGQEKLCALACQLAQAELYADRCGQWPVLCLDDLGSELDAAHQEAVIERLVRTAQQVWVTGTETPGAWPAAETTMFHVEHGTINPS